MKRKNTTSCFITPNFSEKAQHTWACVVITVIWLLHTVTLAKQWECQEILEHQQ